MSRSLGEGLVFEMRCDLRSVLLSCVAICIAGCSRPSPPSIVPPPAPTTPATTVGIDPVEAEPFDANDQVTKLRELRDKGLISEDEFQARKARLLKAGSR